MYGFGLTALSAHLNLQSGSLQITSQELPRFITVVVLMTSLTMKLPSSLTLVSVITLCIDKGEQMDHRDHTEFVEGCFVCKISTISFGTGTAPTRRAGAEVVEARERRWNRDMPAYKALRAQGLQPPRIDGSAELMEKAETRFEIESGKIMPGQAKKIESTVKAFEAITGTSVYQPNTTPVNL